MLDIHADIRSASTLPSSFYTSADSFERVRDRVFARSWQFAGSEREVGIPGSVRPFELLPGLLDEPLLLVRDHGDALHCLSNVCTHRGNLLQASSAVCRQLRCRYHGRRFKLDGSFEFMPEFEQSHGFPGVADDLPAATLTSLDGLLFVSLDPAIPAAQLLAPLRERVEELPLREFHFEAALSRDYLVHAHWALYVDNYLEGFHIPYVHPDLARSLDYDRYESELHAWGNLQIGRARAGELCFEGSDVAAYYYWLFPNTMLNFYPWGLSVNVVQPLDCERTRVAFRSYVWRPQLLDRGAGAALDRVEREDEAVVEQVQRGMRSRLYRRGRFSPRREQGVHHFHRLMSEALG